MRIVGVAALLGLLALTGCGTYRWERQGSSNTDFQRESAECQQQSAPGQWENCMMGRGWRYKTGWF
ncbi:MAG TPA: hypothetical protein VGD08_20135 [Stellaceae bacterium]|jgi:hypothetical protein